MENSKSILTSSHSKVIEGSSDEIVVPVVQEHLHVEKIVAERIAARVKIRTTHYDVPVAETLQTERLEVERMAVDRIVADRPQTRMEGNVMIIPVVEEILVRQYRIVEEVRIISRADQVDYTETVVLRRQDVTVEDDLADVPSPPTPHG